MWKGVGSVFAQRQKCAIIIDFQLSKENWFYVICLFFLLLDNWPQLSFGTNTVVISEEAEPPWTKKSKILGLGNRF